MPRTELILTVKGNRWAAARAAADRGIPAAFERQVQDRTTLRVNAEHEAKVEGWYKQRADVEYDAQPAGTLLTFHSETR